MAYTDGKAAGRQTGGRAPAPAPAPASASAQERTQGQTAKFHTYGNAPNAGVAVGNQIRFDGGKGFGVAGRPTALASRPGKSMGAVENPSGSTSKPGKF